MKRAYLSTVSVSAIALLTPLAALADTPAPPSAARNAPAEPSTAVGDIIVTAQRKSELQAKTPVALSVLNAAALATRGITTDQDLQSAVPGLLIISGFGQNQLNYSLRGQAVENFTGSDPAVLPYINEIAIPSSGAIALFDLQSVQVLKGPQGTLFGRNSTGGAVLYTTQRPTDELGGYLTGRIGDYDLKSVEGALNVPLIADRLLARVSGYYQHQQGYEYNLFDGSHPGTGNRYDIRASFDWKIADDINNSLVVDFYRSKGTNTAAEIYYAYAPGQTNNGYALNSLFSVFYSPALDQAIGVPGAWQTYLAAHPGTYPGGLVAFAALQRQRPYDVDLNSPLGHNQKNIVLSNATTWDIQPNLRLKNIFGYIYSRDRDAFDTDGTAYGLNDSSTSGYTTIRNLQQYTEELQIQGETLGHKLSYTAGLYYLNKYTPLNGAFGSVLDLEPFIAPTLLYQNSKNTIRSYAGYAQVKYDLSGLTGLSGLSLTAGLRYNSEDQSFSPVPGSVYYNYPGAPAELKRNDKRLSWQFGLQDQIDSETLLYIVSRRSARSGGFNTSAPPFPATAAGGGAAFDPEVATDVEGGVKFNGRLGGVPVFAAADGYFMNIDNVQRSLIAQIPGGSIAGLTVNVPQAQVYGFEGETAVKPASWLTLGVKSAFTHGEYTKNTSTVFGQTTTYGPYAASPKFDGSIYADMSIPLPDEFGSLSINADVYHQASFLFGSLSNTIGPDVTIPSYTLANFKVGLDNVARSGVSVAFFVKNAFDKTYYTGGAPAGNSTTTNLVVPGEPRTFYFQTTVKF